MYYKSYEYFNMNCVLIKLPWSLKKILFILLKILPKQGLIGEELQDDEM